MFQTIGSDCTILDQGQIAIYSDAAHLQSLHASFCTIIVVISQFQISFKIKSIKYYSHFLHNIIDFSSSKRNFQKCKKKSIIIRQYKNIIIVNLKNIHNRMYATNRNFQFFDTRMKKNNSKVGNHSRSISSKNQHYRNSASSKKKIITKPALSKKEIQIREAIEYRYKKSKMREYAFEDQRMKARNPRPRSRSSDMPEFKGMKNLKVVALKQFHDEKQKTDKRKSETKSSLLKRFKIRADSSLIIKTEASEKSFEKSFKPYLQKTPREEKKQDWKFISIQLKNEKKSEKTRKNQMKAKSYRTLNVQQKTTRTKVKSVQKYWDITSKLKELSKVKKYKI